MPHGPDAAPPPQDVLAARLLRLIDADDLDGAIEAGLAEFDDTAAALPDADRTRLRLARRKLLDAWAARERHRARNARLARRAAEREARRASSLPPAAAAALARARARARGGPA